MTIAVVLLILLGTGILIYNRLVLGRNACQNAFAQIGVQLKRRHDLIPNLVETARAYLQHESTTLEKVTQARNHAASCLKQALPENATGIAALAEAENALTQAVRSLMIQVEAYPELQAAENMRQLSEEITSTENRVAFARQAYNDAVMSYNTLRQMFPHNLIAAWFGHTQDAVLLTIPDSAAMAQNPPKISF
ncbi:MAG: LemA family protein [Alysiella sp.]|uniref:LemA family protein n=1 Tax=Alysiella sp. TaxID=1872483 RepID=UPI0026DB2B7C|nr:LemA family protein [Alysiella sp.]MDO4434359.1 LemA family protein [Alysiella sp.]